jgi:hypothetical protein
MPSSVRIQANKNIKKVIPCSEVTPDYYSGFPFLLMLQIKVVVGSLRAHAACN